MIVIELRGITWWTLDEISEVINQKSPESVRSSVYRAWKREEINNVPQKEKARNLKNTIQGLFILT